MGSSRWSGAGKVKSSGRARHPVAQVAGIAVGHGCKSSDYQTLVPQLRPGHWFMRSRPFALYFLCQPRDLFPGRHLTFELLVET